MKRRVEEVDGRNVLRAITPKHESRHTCCRRVVGRIPRWTARWTPRWTRWLDAGRVSTWRLSSGGGECVRKHMRFEIMTRLRAVAISVDGGRRHGGRCVGSGLGGGG